ncbi:MAG: PLP-dependent aminotransferase family protein [Candidatus Eremiobacteraeota bacterium]|nr:PLP-dependent aminotransferase family protein [Candidatus Eremiobacteraeota bacterium]MBC5828326.1 PLP-dependent aminotransferase family protein [Candidatus Eremiobacteraeota bacterium]
MGRLKASAIREILKVTEMPDVISFAGGLPAPELFPVTEFAQACQEVLAHDGPAALQYSVTEGYPPLRRWVCDYLARTSHIEANPDQILIISGSQQGLDLVGKVLLDPGDLVIIENPAYLGAIQAFDAYQADYLNVETDDEGMRTDDLVRVLGAARRKPKLLYLVPNFQNPSGITLSLQRRKAVISIAAEHGIPIFEDDPYGRLRYSHEPIPSLMSLAGGRGCVYMSTVSKIMAPGMRVAWLVIPERALYEKAVPAKQAADLHTSSFTQRVVYAFARAPGALEAHIAGMLPVYARRRDLMLRALERYMPPGCSWTRPDGGLFLWARVPESIDTQDLLAHASGKKVAFVPGAPFWVNRDVRNTMRLNFSNASDDMIVEGIRRLSDLVKAALK